MMDMTKERGTHMTESAPTIEERVELLEQLVLELVFALQQNGLVEVVSRDA